MKLEKKDYLQPQVELWHLSGGCSLLESLSLEGNVEDIIEGETLESVSDW